MSDRSLMRNIENVFSADPFNRCAVSVRESTDEIFRAQLS